MQVIEDTKEKLTKKDIELSECKEKITDLTQKLKKSEENEDSLTSENV